jgi:hypothetical protein
MTDEQKAGQRSIKIVNTLVVAAAVRTDDGVIHSMKSPARHHHILHALHSFGTAARGEQGFVLNNGTFVNREMAGQIAIVSGQIKELAHPPKLYTEDLW